jgi:hypothetical protein
MKPDSFFNFIAFQSLIVLFLAGALTIWFKPSLWLHVFVTYVGALTGWLSVRTDEILVLVFLLLSFGCFAGFAAGKRAWQLGIVLGIWAPICNVVANSLKPVATPISLPGIIMPMLFGLIGAYAGVLLKRLSRTTLPVAA